MERFPFCVKDLTTIYVPFMRALTVRELVQIHPNRLSKPSAICAASNDLLSFFCSDDESQYVYQITLTFDGVTIHGNATRFTAYLFSIVDLLSIPLLDQCAFFSGASSQGGLYKCELSTKTVTQAVCNSTLPCVSNFAYCYGWDFLRQ